MFVLRFGRLLVAGVFMPPPLMPLALFIPELVDCALVESLGLF